MLHFAGPSVLLQNRAKSMFSIEKNRTFCAVECLKRKQGVRSGVCVTDTSLECCFPSEPEQSGSSFTWWLERQILQRFVDTSVFVAQLSNFPHFAPNYLHGIEESKLAIGAQLLEPAVKGWLSPQAGGGITQAADSSFPGLKC